MLVELADEVEQQLAARACERQIAKRVEDDENKPRELGSLTPGLTDLGAVFEPVHNAEQRTSAWNPAQVLVSATRYKRS